MNFVERREFFRLPVEIPAYIEQYDEHKPAHRQNAVIRNLSGGGLKVETTNRLNMELPVSVAFSLPFNDGRRALRSFVLSCKVLREDSVKSNRLYHYGTQFSSIVPSVQDKIVKYLFDLQIASRYHFQTENNVT